MVERSACSPYVHSNGGVASGATFPTHPPTQAPSHYPAPDDNIHHHHPPTQAQSHCCTTPLNIHHHHPPPPTHPGTSTPPPTFAVFANPEDGLEGGGDRVRTETDHAPVRHPGVDPPVVQLVRLGAFQRVSKVLVRLRSVKNRRQTRGDRGCKRVVRAKANTLHKKKIEQKNKLQEIDAPHAPSPPPPCQTMQDIVKEFLCTWVMLSLRASAPSKRGSGRPSSSPEMWITTGRIGDATHPYATTHTSTPTAMTSLETMANRQSPGMIL